MANLKKLGREADTTVILQKCGNVAAWIALLALAEAVGQVALMFAAPVDRIPYIYNSGTGVLPIISPYGAHDCLILAAIVAPIAGVLLGLSWIARRKYAADTAEAENQ